MSTPPPAPAACGPGRPRCPRDADTAGAQRPAVAPGLVLAVSVLAISWAAPLVRFTDAPALAVSFWRLAFAMGMICLLLTARGEWRALRALSARDWAVAGLAGALLAGHFVTWIASVALTSIAASVTLVSTQPIWVAVLAALALGERPGGRQWLGIGVAVLGAAWIGWGDFAAGPDPLRGDLLALAGAVLAAAYYVIGRGLRRHVTLWAYVAVVYGIAMLTLGAAMLATGVPFAAGYTGTDWTVFALLALGPMMIGHTGQNWALRYLPAYAVNLTLLGEPVGSTLIAWLLPGIREAPPPQALAGGTLILMGILLGWRRKR